MRPHLELWAKLGKATWPDEYHPVICHLIDVANCALALWQSAIREPIRCRVARQLGISSADDAGRLLAFWIGAHDIGKGTPCFQFRDERQKELRQRLDAAGFDFPAGNKHHTDTGTKALYDELVAGGDCWPKVDPPLARKIAVAVGGHHGTFPQNWDQYGDILGNSCWAEARREILKELAQRFQLPQQSPQLVPGSDQSLWMYVAGLTSVADWIGSNVEFFEPRGNRNVVDQGLDVGTYFRKSGDRAKEALDRLGWLDRAEPTYAVVSFDSATGISNPRPLQDEIIRLAKTLKEPHLIIVEAPMGEGKTEAAWYVADCWDRIGGQGTYVALPTMATSNQMFSRVDRFLRPREGKKNLMLQHGKAALNEQFEKLKFAARIYDTKDTEMPSAVVAESWFAANKKHGLLAPYGVGTIDQALLAVLQIKHVFVRLFGLAGKCVILDEVHAYDAYMTTLMERLLNWLAALRCPVVLLSATLPANKRAALLRAYAGPNTPEPEHQAYPRVTTIEVGGNPSATHVEADRAREKSIKIEWVADDAVIDKLKAALKDGGCAAVIRNTVGLAQETYVRLRDGLKESGIRVELFHARFPFGRRQEIEDAVLKRYGKDGGVTDRDKCVLVATQVIEQSLDLDFDVMVSDVAPVDLVLQRAGRLHRHARGKRPPGAKEPYLFLIKPGERAGVPFFGKSEYVYSRFVLLKSFVALSARDRVQLPVDLEFLVEQIYGDEPLRIPEGYQESLDASKRMMQEEQRKQKACGEKRNDLPPNR